MSVERRTAVTAFLVVAPIAVVLTGCDIGIYQSPGAIKLAGEHVEFAVCEPIVGAEIRVFGDEGGNSDEVRYMQASGDVRLDPETALSSGEVPAGLDATVWSDPIVTPGARVNMFVYDVDGNVEFPIEFSVPASGLSETMWTRADGRQDADACD